VLHDVVISDLQQIALERADGGPPLVVGEKEASGLPKNKAPLAMTLRLNG